MEFMSEEYGRSLDHLEGFLTDGEGEIGQSVMDKLRYVRAERNSLFRTRSGWKLHPSQGLIEARRVKAKLGECEELLGPQPDGLTVVEIVIRRAETKRGDVTMALDQHTILRARMTEQDWMRCLLSQEIFEPHPITLMSVNGMKAEPYRPNADHTNQSLAHIRARTLLQTDDLLVETTQSLNFLEARLVNEVPIGISEAKELALEAAAISRVIPKTVKEMASCAEKVSRYSTQLQQELEGYFYE